MRSAQMWRNWQTQQTQNLPVATSCGFKSHHLHYKPRTVLCPKKYPGGKFAAWIFFKTQKPSPEPLYNPSYCCNSHHIGACNLNPSSRVRCMYYLAASDIDSHMTGVTYYITRLGIGKRHSSSYSRLRT